MKSWLSGKVQWPSEEPRKEAVKLFIILLPVIGVFLGISDWYIKIIAASATFSLEFVAVRYVTKISVPEALAIGYFKSFAEPVGKALEADGWIEYKDPGKGSIDMKQVHARLEIVLPKDLSVKDINSKNGFLKLQETVNTKMILGIIHLTKDDSDGKRPLTIHFDLKNDQGNQRLIVFDVPGALNPLRFIQYEEPCTSSKKEQAKRVERAEQALKEFSEELERKIEQADMKRVSLCKKGLQIETIHPQETVIKGAITSS